MKGPDTTFRHSARSVLSLSWVTVVAAMLAMPGLAMGTQQATEFDIKAYDFEVLTTGLIPRPAESVEADEKYYLQCMFGVAGSISTTTSTQIHVLVNGQLIHNAPVSIHDDQHWVATRALWTPPTGGSYTAKCEVNPTKALVEASYTNNQMTKLVAVSGLHIDPADAIAAPALRREALNPLQKGPISSDLAKQLATMPDIRVQGLDIHPVDNNGTPKSTTVAKGRPGRTYYLGCEMDPAGILAVSSVRFLFRVNGQVVKDAQVSVGSGPPVEVGAEWTPQAAGNYQLSCEANPQKTFQEASFANNKGNALFPVQSGGN